MLSVLLIVKHFFPSAVAPSISQFFHYHWNVYHYPKWIFSPLGEYLLVLIVRHKNILPNHETWPKTPSHQEPSVTDSAALPGSTGDACVCVSVSVCARHHDCDFTHCEPWLNAKYVQECHLLTPLQLPRLCIENHRENGAVSWWSAPVLKIEKLQCNEISNLSIVSTAPTNTSNIGMASHWLMGSIWPPSPRLKLVHILTHVNEGRQMSNGPILDSRPQERWS